MATTLDEVWVLFRETDRKFQDTNRRFQQTEKRLNTLSRQLGEQGNRLGDFVQAMGGPRQQASLDGADRLNAPLNNATHALAKTQHGHVQVSR
ncbi:MAG: hypothetical protein FKY71_20455 [Spiribacter salinus]|jgi:hypothetical protein|uniref:Uncharacterized protein n=3 Tax=Chromatiales TaxID=135613 RepID=A0A9X1B6M0_9GAMM|nr:hypothetical protein [Lamprobacter modestohalophilus]MBK1621765.1 hypothetical protein [Lamprobacter modestohalophilus]TQE90446.1 MAG: hypothetical protein FKY71_20455 [Spiribacter salinus]